MKAEPQKKKIRGDGDARGKWGRRGMDVGKWDEMMQGTKVYASAINRHVRLMGLSTGPLMLGVDVIMI